MERKVVCFPGSDGNGRSVASIERNHRTRAFASSRYPDSFRDPDKCTSDRWTGPKSQRRRSKKWIPMLLESPPDFSLSPFHEWRYQLPREVM
jgi:hypothetical protein